MFPVSWKYLFFLLGIFMTFLPSCKSNSHGAPDSRCGTMIPGHWVSEQTTPSPFHIQISSDSVHEGEMIYINLTSSRNQNGFKGFLIQVKRPGQNSQNFGSFNPYKSDTFQSQPLNCFGNENSAMTHKDSVEKQFVHLVWIAPVLESGDDGVYEIRVTFVQNFWTIWPNQTPGKVIHVTKREGEQNIIENITTKVSPTTSTPGSPPVLILMPQLRDADIHQTQSMNITTKGKGTNMQGSWEYFKKSWMNFLNYFGF